MENVIRDLLAHDNKCRENNLFLNDIFKLHDLDPNAEYDYSLPTLVRDGDKSLHKTFRQMNIEAFQSKFLQKFPYFAQFDWTGVLAAGGAVGQFIIGGVSKDIDLFIYGSIDEANQIVKRVLNHIIVYAKADCVQRSRKKCDISPDIYEIDISQVSIDDIDVKFIKRKNTITVTEYNIQIILRLYSSPSEIIHGFDLGSSAVGFDGKDLYFTSLSKFAYEYGCNIVDTTRRSTTYERRLIKYFDRGFEIILPHFNINKTSNRLMDLYDLNDYCEMPHFTFTYKRVIGNGIVVSRFYQKNNIVSDYDANEIDNEYVAFFQGLYCILRNKTDDFIVISKNINDIIDGSLKYLGNKINHFYANLEMLIRSDRFPSKLVEKYITVCECEEVFASRYDPSNIIRKQIGHVNGLVANISKLGQVKWMTTNVMTQLTSSYNPIIENPQEWYGEFYREL